MSLLWFVWFGFVWFGLVVWIDVLVWWFGFVVWGGMFGFDQLPLFFGGCTALRSSLNLAELTAC